MDEIGASSGSRLTFGGLASGLDTSAILDALLEVERQPLERLETNRSGIATRQALFRDLNSRFLALRDAARGLDNRSDSLAGPSTSEELLAASATSSDETRVVARALDGASPGSFDVHVDQLATVGRRVSFGFAASDVPISLLPGTLTVDFGGSAPIVVAVDPTTTLDDLASAIDTSEENDGSVAASVLFDGSQYRLVVSGTQTGAANDVAVTSSFGSFVDPALSQAAQDAQFEVFGVSITRAANEFSDVIEGVQLELRGVHEAATDVAQVSVTRDDDAIAARLQSLADAFNAVREFSLQQSTVDPTTGRAGPLSGDVTLRSLEGRTRDALAGLYVFDGNPFASLSAVGLRFDAQGMLTLERDVLTSALDQDPLGVRELLSGNATSDGAATALARALEPVVRPIDGLLAQRDDSFDRELRDVDVRIERFEDRLAQREEALVRRFSALESLLASLQSQASFLGRIGNGE